jgi:hypothetical protein
MVLMGGSLALSCGGSVLEKGNPSGAGGSSGMNSGGSSAVGGGGTSAVGTAGSLSLAGGAGGASALQVGSFECPPAQWECANSGCFVEFSFSSGTLPTGCVCDRARPQSAADCSASEAFVCVPGYDTDSVPTSSPPPSTWDGATHVRCSCVQLSLPATYADCSAACSAASLGTECGMASETTCDDAGVCTATSADVLRQDGILCGCAPVGLK